MQPADDDLIPKPQLAISFGVDTRTISRWMVDRAIGFPQPVVINNRNYFRRADVEAWKAERVRKSMSQRASFRANAAEAVA